MHRKLETPPTLLAHDFITNAARDMIGNIVIQHLRRQVGYSEHAPNGGLPLIRNTSAADSC
jgi:hypothetical protein